MEMGENHKESTEMAITNTGNHDILLGTDWLKAHNPSINWAKNKLRFDCCLPSCFPDKNYTTPTLFHQKNGKNNTMITLNPSTKA